MLITQFDDFRKILSLNYTVDGKMRFFDGIAGNYTQFLISGHVDLVGRI